MLLRGLQGLSLKLIFAQIICNSAEGSSIIHHKMTWNTSL